MHFGHGKCRFAAAETISIALQIRACHVRSEPSHFLVLGVKTSIHAFNGKCILYWSLKACLMSLMQKNLKEADHHAPDLSQNDLCRLGCLASCENASLSCLPCQILVPLLKLLCFLEQSHIGHCTHNVLTISLGLRTVDSSRQVATKRK